ncbi:hypothetical protein Tco_0276736 [Tanacetum coccineum]
MTTPITTTIRNSQIHNDIMAASSRDRLLMLITGRYAQWQSRFLRYVDTKPNKKELRTLDNSFVNLIRSTMFDMECLSYEDFDDYLGFELD